jgi:hypothetical protein
MSMCEHDLAERETACADGFCPICAAAELALLRPAIDVITAAVDFVDACSSNAHCIRCDTFAVQKQLTGAQEKLIHALEKGGFAVYVADGRPKVIPFAMPPLGSPAA